jgi:2-aminoadipate transaminase
MRREGPAALQYSVTEGLPRLREWIATRLRSRYGIACGADDVLMMSGSQQALDLIGKILLDPGDLVAVENPTYLGAIQAFDAYEARYLTVATDDGGIVPEALEAELARAPRRPKFLYLVPNFQNPTGRTIGAERREAVVRICEARGLMIVEDDPYGELCFDGTCPRPLASYDSAAPILYCGTGSKIVAPGLRLGWLVARNPALRERIVPAKQSVDLHSGTLAQYLFHEFVSQGGRFEAHVARIREVYRQRRDAMLAALREHMPACVRYAVPRGGMFFWLAIEAAIDTEELFAAAARERVIFVPGRAFYANRDRGNELRLNFSNSQPEAIAAGIERLGRAVTTLTFGS